MPLFKKDVLGNYIIIKQILIVLFGSVGYYRFFVVNRTSFKGLENLKGLPKKNVLFISNHQTYFMDVFLMYFALASSRVKVNNPRWFIYLFNPINFYYVAAAETMRQGLIPKIMAMAGAVSIKRTWRANGQMVKRKVDPNDLENIFKALDDGWVISFPQGTTTAYAKGRKGSAVLIKLGKPVVVPIQINGFRKAFDKSGMRIKKRNIELSIVVKPPMKIDYDAPAETILEQMMNEIGQDDSQLPPIIREKVKGNQ